MNAPHPLTVILQSKNEEAFIRRCITSVEWADEILLLDSGSEDRTVEIASSLGARVIETDWPGWSRQRKKAEELASNDWVLALDCDEIVSQELGRSIMQTLAGEMRPEDGYSVNRRGDFLGVLLPNSSNRRNRLEAIRLYNRTRSGFNTEARVHEEVTVPGNKIALSGDLLHWRGYGMHDYFRVFNDYATLEAEVLKENGAKPAAWRVIVMPVLRFLWLYLRKGEWRLGTRGLIHAGLKACSEFMRYSKLWEMHHVPDPVLHPPHEAEARPT